MIRRPLLLLASGLACAFLVAPMTQRLAAQASLEPQQEHDVTGKVINSVTRQPISRALVKINGGVATFTDREGRFRFAAVKDQYLTVTAEKPGYFAEQNRGGRHPGTIGIIVIQQPLTNTSPEPGIIELTPEAILFGTVTDAGGAPLPGVPLTLNQAVIQNGMKRWVQAHGSVTNADGEFRFANLIAGEYRLITNFHLESFFGADVHEGYLPTRYPEGTGAITLAADQQKPIDLNLRQGKLYPVTGSMHGRKAGQGVMFSVVSASGEEIQPFQISTGGADTFGILLPDGSQQIKAKIFDGRISLIASASVAVDRCAVADVPLDFAPVATFPIEIEQESVTNSSSEPEASAANQQRPFLQLVSLNANIQLQYSAQSMDGTPQGPLGFSGVEPGRYLLTAEKGGPWHVTSATCGSTDLMREPLTVAGGAAGCALHIVFSDASASLTMTALKDGKPTEAFAYLVPVPNLTTYQPQSYISADGPGSTANLGAGVYDVLAFEKPLDLEYRNPEVMQRYAQYARSITLAPGQNASIQLDVVPVEK